MTFFRPQARLLAAMALLLTSTSPLAAETVPAAPASETFRDSIQVSVVTLDVFVTDKRGKPIPGLQKEDFTILEDGKPVEISNFFAETERAGTVVSATSPAPNLAAPADAAGPAAAAAADQRLRLVVFVDDVSLSAANRLRILQNVGKFLHTGLKPGDESDAGPLRREAGHPASRWSRRTSAVWTPASRRSSCSPPTSASTI